MLFWQLVWDAICISWDALGYLVAFILVLMFYVSAIESQNKE
jgi:hypothetical protein